MVIIGGSFYEGNRCVRREPRVSFSDGEGGRFTVPAPIEIDAEICSEHDWLWRVTWHEGTGYGAVYLAVLRVEPFLRHNGGEDLKK